MMELYKIKINHSRIIAVTLMNHNQSTYIQIHLNNHASNDCESASGSDNIATRVRAKNAKARQKKIHEKSQHFTARNRDNTSTSESLFIRILTLKVQVYYWT